jgi:hypothetical protein
LGLRLPPNFFKSRLQSYELATAIKNAHYYIKKMLIYYLKKCSKKMLKLRHCWGISRGVSKYVDKLFGVGGFKKKFKSKYCKTSSGEKSGTACSGRALTGQEASSYECYSTPQSAHDNAGIRMPR